MSRKTMFSYSNHEADKAITEIYKKMLESEKSKQVSDNPSPLEEKEKKDGHWMEKVVKRPGALTKKAEKSGESDSEYAEQHKDDKGRTGKQSRLALTFAKFRKGKK